MAYTIISFDIFQTLVDVNKRIPEIWRGILKSDYTDSRAAQGAKAVLGALPSIYEKSVSSEQFFTMEEVYRKCAQEVVKKLDFKVLPQDVAYHLMLQHSKAPFYDDVSNCIQKLHNKYSIILSSDSNHLMVDDLLNRIEYDRCFISDDLKCYKGDKHGQFFQTVLHKLKVTPNNIIHIGDSYADILGAHRCGITSCWINRENRKWSSTIRPDYSIQTLSDLMDIL